MKAIEILYNLSPYQNLLEELYQKAIKEKPELIWTKNLRSQYSFITLEIKHASTEDSYQQMSVEVKFQLQGDKVVLNGVYTEEKTEKEKLEKLIQSNKAVHEAQWHSAPNNTWYHDEKKTAYLNI